VQLKTAFKTYLALPLFSGERTVSDAAEAQREKFDTSLREYLQMPWDNTAEHLFKLDILRNKGVELDRALAQIANFDITAAEHLGIEISSIRAQSLYLKIILDFISILLAVFGTIFAIRVKNLSVKHIATKAEELEVFAGRIAHDLINPLGSILLATTLLERGPTPEEKNKHNERIRITANRMNRVIEDLLNFARAGAKPDLDARADVGEMIENTLVAAKLDAEKNNIRLQAEAIPTPLFVACPSGILGSVLINLIRNALAYVIDGHQPIPQVTVRAKDGYSVVYVEVEDNGPGVAPDKEKLIFQPYTRDNSRVHALSLGIGLATVKRLVETYGGKVGVKSSYGNGSRFWFELPKASPKSVSDLRPDSSVRALQI